MRNIAVTGSFASGKTYVINCIKNLGYKVFSCDDYVKLLYQDKRITAQIEQEIKGLKVFDKAKLAEIIYDDDKMRKKLENIVHPLVRNGIKDFEFDNQNENLVFTEVPLLFESGFNEYFSKVICVFCLEETRWERAKLRKIKDFDSFEKIKKIQLPQEVKMARSDFVINSEVDVEEKIIEIINKII
ncbi:MAG: dephospho-CoA kinase [Rickettsiaceae bacterium]|jgi:dephospho-CoA kinase|nr:dephospho-CoA kinase [Rickettsiaceae bacterium]